MIQHIANLGKSSGESLQGRGSPNQETRTKINSNFNPIRIRNYESAVKEGCDYAYVRWHSHCVGVVELIALVEQKIGDLDPS
jgi:hypothetical protein